MAHCPLLRADEFEVWEVGEQALKMECGETCGARTEMTKSHTRTMEQDLDMLGLDALWRSLACRGASCIIAGKSTRVAALHALQLPLSAVPFAACSSASSPQPVRDLSAQAYFRLFFGVVGPMHLRND